jgi:hypothetical protein
VQVRTTSELGVLILDYLMRSNLDQKSLAASVHVSREWIAEIGKNKATARIGLVMRPWRYSESFSTLSRKLHQAPKKNNRRRLRGLA